MEVKFVIPGDPVGKQRVRAAFGQKRLYTPNKTINYESFVKHCYYGFPHFCERIVGMELHIYLPIPASVSKKKKQLMIDKKILPGKKPDTSNVLKSVEDGLNGVAYDDDKQICEHHLYRWYGETPRVEVRLWDIKA